MNLTATQRIYLPLKRLFDIIFSLFALIILAPVFLAVAVIVKQDSPGPVFFRHICYKKNGKIFKEHKFRTMLAGSDDYTKHLTPEEQDEFKKEYKLTNDPRVTRTGRFLRKSRIDEIPQFFNILRGDMSLVGPRPVAIDEIYKYTKQGATEKLLSIKPGLTGYWQVNNQPDITYSQRIQMQIHYVDAFSLFLDIEIFLKTFIVVLRGTGT